MFGQTVRVYGMQPLFLLAVDLTFPIIYPSKKAFFSKIEAKREASLLCPFQQKQTTSRYTVYTWKCRGTNKDILEKQNNNHIFEG